MDDRQEPHESAVFVFEHDVRDDEIDVLGHVNNLAYLKWMQSAAVAHSSACGWTTERYLESGGGWVVRSHKIEYLNSALANDTVVVRTWIAGFKKVTSLRRYQIVRKLDQAVLAEAETNWAFIGFEHRVPRRIPQEVIEDFRRYQASVDS
ncbi:MAG: acyl-CoA thioesterase [Planctomycetaceae bacterium]|nr:acyl-CoA thioesterase [Planctomycetales bacterium]MCB9939986.1 acyl-CoA thioesterase [Planctomycetaceae bacterium]